MSKKIGIIFGPLNAGKGTQASKLASEFNYYHLTTGGIIRDKIEKDGDTDLKKWIDAGNLVSDKQMEDIFISKMKALANTEYELVVIDGLPRTVPQVEFIQSAINQLSYELCWVILLDAPLEFLIERAVNRVMGPNGEVYNYKFNPPPADIPKDQLKQRADDNPETIKKRYDIYLKDTLPCLRTETLKKAKFKQIDATQDIDEVYKDIKKIITNL